MKTQDVILPSEIAPGDWELRGNGRMTPGQMKLLNAACGDLAAQINWHGNKLTKDDWRHMLSGTMLGWRMMPAIDRGEGNAGFIMLGGSSIKLSKSQATDAITCAFHIGDNPSEQNIKSQPVSWCPVVRGARGIQTDEVIEQLARRYV